MASPIVVVGTRRWHMILLLAYSAFAGGLYLHSPPVVVAAYVPHPVVIGWSVLMLVSGGIGAAAAIWWRSSTALGVAVGALVMNTAGLLLFVAAAFAVLPDGWAAVRGTSWIVAWGLANLLEAGQTQYALHQLRRP